MRLQAGQATGAPSYRTVERTGQVHRPPGKSSGEEEGAPGGCSRAHPDGAEVLWISGRNSGLLNEWASDQQPAVKRP